MLIHYILIFIFGTVVGSFLNVVIIRLKNGDSIFKKRSHCLFCARKLTWKELIPIFSFLFQKRRCLGCRKKISWQYPLVEFFTGLIFVLIVWKFFELSLLGIAVSCFLFFVSCFLIIIFVYDLKYYLVADQVIYPAIIAVSIWYLVFSIFFKFYTKNDLLNAVYGAAIVGGLFLAIVLLSKEKWMGWGDVKIAVLIGLLLGPQKTLLALFLAFLSGAIVSIVLIVLKKKKIKSELPFGPFLVSATFISIFWGYIILNWYLNLFL
jgi:leader peptidase (prepilin peptidase)/N-methyltransferase